MSTCSELAREVSSWTPLPDANCCRVIRAAVAAPVILGTGGQQADLLRRLAIFFGRDSAIGRWLMEMFWRW